MEKKQRLRLVTWLLLAVLLVPLPVQAAGIQDPLAVEQQVYAYLTEVMNFPSASACGVLANMEHESAFQLTVLGDSGTSFGLCQWHAGRYTALRSFCAVRNLDYRTVEGQMEYLNYELTNHYSPMFLALKTMDNTPDGAYRAAYLWCTQFERPANAEQKAVLRGNTARFKYWNRYNSLSLYVEDPDPILPPEEVIAMVQQQEVTIPLPPEQPQKESVRHYSPEPAPMEEYTVRNLPKPQPGPNAPAGFAVGMLFLGLGEKPLGEPQLPPKPQDEEE